MDWQTTIDVLPGASAPQVDAPNINALSIYNPAEWVKWGFGGAPSSSGQVVNARTALRHSPVWQAINVLSGDVSQLVFQVQRVDGDRKVHATDHPVDWTIGVQPNQYQTPDLFYENMMTWALGWGNGVAVIEQSEGQINLRPLPPDTTRCEEIDFGEYLITTRINNQEKAFMPDETVHIRGLSQDGFWGLSAVTTCRNRIGGGMALQEHSNNFYSTGARPSGVVTIPQNVQFSPEAKGNFLNEWQTNHGMSQNRPAFLYDGMDFKPMTMSAEDAQWAETADLDVKWVAGVFNLPPYKLGYMRDSSVRSNLEAQQREYFNTSLSRWVTRFRMEYERKLFTTAARRARRYRVYVDIDQLTQGTRKEHMETVSLGITNRLLTRNEGREEIGLNPVDGGDEFENPAIDTNVSSGTSESTDSEAIENALRTRGVDPLLAAEYGKLRAVARGKGDFIAWLNEFCEDYETFAEPFLASLAALAGSDWQTAVKLHAASLKSNVLMLTEFAPPAELPGLIKGYQENAPQRAEQLTKNLLRCDHG